MDMQIFMEQRIAMNAKIKKLIMSCSQEEKIDHLRS